MLRVYLVRHGETDWNIEGRLQGTTDIELNARGLAQANLLAERLAEETGISAIYSSSLRRAYVTAETIGARLALKPIADVRLVERRLGEMEGLTSADIAARYPEFHKTWHVGDKRVPFPGEEARDDFRARLVAFLDEVQARHAEGKIAIVTHGGALSMLMATVMHLDLERRFPFWFDNASLSLVEFGGSVPRVLTLNDTCHLREGSPHPNGKQEAALDAKTSPSDARSIVQSAV